MSKRAVPMTLRNLQHSRRPTSRPLLRLEPILLHSITVAIRQFSCFWREGGIGHPESTLLLPKRFHRFSNPSNTCLVRRA